MNRLEFSWFLPTFGDTTAYADPTQRVTPSLDMFKCVVTVARPPGSNTC